jgi:tRNA pseudouridine32 synthase/23S rRNA pseudouridine746 synthase
VHQPHLFMIHHASLSLTFSTWMLIFWWSISQAGCSVFQAKPWNIPTVSKPARSKTHPEARIVHRLDMDTSGVMVLAMNAQAHRHLGLQFERRKTEKTYVAEVWGQIERDAGEIDLPLVCDWPNRPKQMVSFEHGKPALTRWQVIMRNERTTRVRLFPFTGRSHQLRVHMLSLGHPIVGDRFYATGDALEASPRLRLHAESLTLHHPTGGRRVTFETACEF